MTARGEKMLTDTISEEEFELKEEEPWFDRQDLEHGTGTGHARALPPTGHARALPPNPFTRTGMISHSNIRDENQIRCV